MVSFKNQKFLAQDISTRSTTRSLQADNMPLKSSGDPVRSVVWFEDGSSMIGRKQFTEHEQAVN